MLSGNFVVIAGRAVADAQTKQVGSSQVTSFRVVSNRFVKKKNGEGEEKATYIDCETWDKRAEYAADKVKKGVPLLVQGRLETDEWTDKKTNEKRSRLKVYVESLQVDGTKNGGGSNGEPVASKAAKSTSSDEGEGEGGPELPF